EYTPPTLTDAQLTGVWRGGGAELRLSADGRARFSRLPYTYELESGGVDRCDGRGTWRRDDGKGPDGFGDPGIALDAASCGEQVIWTIGGTAKAPELYVPFGDLDAADLRILTK
ncbi:hypothetical protein G3I40_16050, partial [Streptomyces sp. SID14478]|nr:hypothetical protein [Streptomyces sp. SID14478]